MDPFHLFFAQKKASHSCKESCDSLRRFPFHLCPPHCCDLLRRSSIRLYNTPRRLFLDKQGHLELLVKLFCFRISIISVRRSELTFPRPAEDKEGILSLLEEIARDWKNEESESCFPGTEFRKRAKMREFEKVVGRWR